MIHRWPLADRLEWEQAKSNQSGSDDAPGQLSFREFVTRVNPRYQWYTHCEVLADALEQVVAGTITRLMVFMPPRHGKSELISRLFSAYYLYRHPERWVGINSYAAELAYTFSRNARDNYQRAGGTLKGDAAAVKHWESGQGGGFWAAGVGGPITGKGFHLGIIDDPIKNAEEAASETIREKQKDWYGSTFYTRAEPDAAIVVVQTRWHDDDLSGWLLSQEDEEPEGWHIINLEAIKEDTEPAFPASCHVAADWRQPGEALCPQRYPLNRLKQIARRIGEYFWNALFQQRPRPLEGSMFKVGRAEIVKAVPAKGERVRFWDRGATDGGGDYTAGVLMQRTGDTYYVLDVVRGQWATDERDAIMKQTAAIDHHTYKDKGGIQQVGEEGPGDAGKDQAAAFIRMMAGYSVAVERASGDKVLRADALSSQWNAGNVKILAGDWNKAYLAELAAFPNGKNDDQVDGSSGAFNRLALNIGGFSMPYDDRSKRRN